MTSRIQSSIVIGSSTFRAEARNSFTAQTESDQAMANPTITASGIASVSLVAVDSTRRGRAGLTIENSDANRLYVLMGSGTASASNFSFSLAQNENAALPGYKGPLTGIWAADGSGSAFVTEYW